MISSKKISIDQIDSSSLTRIQTFNAFTSSYNTGSFTGSFIGRATGSFTGSLTGSLFGTSSFSTNALSASFASTASFLNTLNQNLTFNGNLVLNGTASISTLVVNQTQYSSGSNQLGDGIEDTQTLFGTVIIPTGSLTVTGSTTTTFLTASSLNYPSSDNGEESFIQTDGNGNLSLQYVKTIYEEIVNGEPTQLVKGTPVYVSGSQGAASIVYRADAGDPNKMPVTYISADTLSSGQAGRGIALGLIKGVNTTGYPPGTEIYVGVGGGWTSTRPTGSAIVQTLGYVTKEGNGGQGVVLNPGPNSLPNLPSGSVWVGNSDSLPVSVLTSSLSVASASFATTASYALSSNIPPPNIRRNLQSGSIIYCGYAPTGSLESEAVWTITKIIVANDGSVTTTTSNNVTWTSVPF